MLSKLTVTDQTIVLDGKSFGDVGAYEQIYGSATFAVDPAHPLNRRVVDLGRAPVNGEGQVECRADVWILTPVDASQGNGNLLYHVVNRGRKGALGTYNLAESSNRPHASGHFGDGFLMEQGYTVAACAWQADVPPRAPDAPDLMTLDVPVPTDGGRPITGPVGCEILVDEPTDLHSLGSRYHLPYEVAEGTESSAILTVRERPFDQPSTIGREAWSFDRFTDGRVAIRLAEGFVPGLIYNLVYIGRDPRVMGLGFIATRDFVSHLKYGDESIRDTDLCLERAYAFGSSQSGRFLRHLLYEGFNEDELSRQVFDGLIVNVAGGAMGSFNHRFAQPSRHASAHFDVFYPTEQFPFTDLPQEDPLTGGRGGLLDRCTASGTVPKVFYINTSTEYWNRSASLAHTDLKGETDVDVHPSARIYHFAGTQHGPAGLPSGPSALPGNPVNFLLGHRALLVALDDWVREGREPPASAHGRIADGSLVPLDRLREAWPLDEVLPLPALPRDPRRLEHGERWVEGIIDNEPPHVGQPYAPLLPAIDEDGNERAGIRLPEVAVPLGTFTGWRLRPAAAGAAWAIVGLSGSWLPLPPSAAEAAGSSDPRMSIEERYRDAEDYVAQCVTVAEELVEQRVLLSRDLDLISQRARKMYDWAVGEKRSPGEA